MKRFVFILCLGCLIGCSTTQQITDDSVPQLLMRTPLPLIPATIIQPYFEIDMVLYILDDGSVDQVKLRKASGDAEWDSLAAQSIKEWRFTPAQFEGKPINTWYRMRTTVKYANPKYCSLAEIVCATQADADSVYAALEHGEDFGKLARQYSVDPSREKDGMLGEIDINLFPENIYKILRDLSKDEFSKPVKYGDKFAIFKKRLELDIY